MASASSDLIETWRMGEAANVTLLDAIPARDLGDRYSPRTRNVRAQFVHLHNVRLRWLNHAAPEFAKKLTKLPKEPPASKAQMKSALRASGRAIEAYLEDCVEAGEIKEWQGSPTSFLGYLIAHEAHHRGLILVSLRLAGHKVPPEVVYGLWQWGKH